MMKYSLLLSVFLSGCATFQEPSVVKVPVTTPCKIAMPDKPEMSAYKIEKGDTVDRKAAKLAARELAWRDYILRLETESRVCAN